MNQLTTFLEVSSGNCICTGNNKTTLKHSNSFELFLFHEKQTQVRTGTLKTVSEWRNANFMMLSGSRDESRGANNCYNILLHVTSP